MSAPPPHFPSPFDALGPHPLARDAALAMQARLSEGWIAPGVPSSVLEGPEGGKMFGVLVAREANGTLRVLHAFSGTLAGSFHHPGLAPPAFDVAARAVIEQAMETAVRALQARAATLHASPALHQARSAHEALVRAQGLEREAVKDQHRTRRREREQARAELDAPASSTMAPHEDVLHALAQQSRGDKAQLRRLLAAQAAALAPVAQRRRRLERRLAAVERLRAHVSRTAMSALHDTYRLTNARGETCSLRERFAPHEPPSGAGDCAGAKLLSHALQQGLRPVALAEFWWGAPPPAGGRVRGAFYPACREKCGPLLPFLLEGLEVTPPRAFTPPPATSPGLELVYEDAHLLVVNKPVGLLSVPGRGAHLTDSVLARLRARYPQATGPLLVHRLDLDTSGLLLAALDAETHTALQRQFLTRSVHKRYRAVLEGVPAQARGEITLALRGDPLDRPRQLHDPLHGKSAHTRYEVVSVREGRAEVSLWPLTGRTHQLRVHAAHPAGLGTPIVGDRLYGHPAERLMLHAERLKLTHPVTGAPLILELPAPF